MAGPRGSTRCPTGGVSSCSGESQLERPSGHSTFKGTFYKNETQLDDAIFHVWNRIDTTLAKAIEIHIIQ